MRWRPLLIDSLLIWACRYPELTFKKSRASTLGKRKRTCRDCSARRRPLTPFYFSTKRMTDTITSTRTICWNCWRVIGGYWLFWPTLQEKRSQEGVKGSEWSYGFHPDNRPLQHFDRPLCNK